MREFYIAAFRSRAHAMGFFNALRRTGVPARVVNTPREASVGCGLSVQICPDDYIRAKSQLMTELYSSFAGWFSVVSDGRRVSVSRIL